MKFRLCLSLALMLYLVTPVVAQSEAKYEGSAGYSLLRENFANRHGWVLSFAEKVGTGFGVEAEVGGNYRKTTFLGSQNDFEHSILAGPQFKLRLRDDAKLVPWGHVLVGITLHNVTRPSFALPPSGGVSLIAIPVTDVRFGLQPGGGINY